MDSRFFERPILPTNNAVVERCIEMLEVKLLWTRDWETLDELREAVREWFHVHNY
jgi:hypothetical protein